MCLIFIALDHHPNYRLVVAANRDEFYNRKTAPASFWKGYPNVIGGRDLGAAPPAGQPAGTWMAMAKSGRISMVTNYRDPVNINPQALSRGRLVTDFVVGNESPESYIRQVEKNGKLYNGYNLLVGNTNELWYHSNYSDGVKKLDPGVYGLSNHLLDTPWPKITRGKQSFQAVLGHDRIDPEDLFTVLYDEDRATDEFLPDTGLPLDRERALSAMFIKTENYGTRCSTVVLIDKQGHVIFCERVFDLKTFQFTTQVFEFDIKAV
ncbi:MAG TPA: NRDE family protein [Ohtaekwangia sp.]|nr:NRDE family protein [Ohtaekwangia sp.]